VQVEKGGEGRFREILAAMAEGFESEFASNEPGLSLDVAPADAPERVLSGDSTREALCLLLALPHGVTAMSRDIPGLVETSTNMARVRTGEEEVSVLTSSRSSVTSALEGLVAQIRAVGELAGGRVEPHEGYPAWQPDMESALLARAKKVWTDVHGAEPRLTAIHAGLECGIIGERYPGMDMVSIGPTIENAHSPDERVSISSTERLWAFVRAFVASLAEG